MTEADDLIATIGELHTTFIFDNAAEAKTVWEKVESRCREIAVYRWVPDFVGLTGAQAITLMTEKTPEQIRSYHKARHLLRRGHEIPTPPAAAEALRNRRRQRALTGQKRTRIRSPQGTAIDVDGTGHPYQKQQG